MKKLILGSIVIAILGLTGCEDDAKIAKRNMTKAADNFEITRRIVFYNTWKDVHVQIIEGRCSIEYGQSRTSVICKTSPTDFKRSFVGNSGQITTLVEQLDGIPVNVYHYRRTFKPQSLIPDIDFRGSSEALKDAIIPDTKD